MTLAIVTAVGVAASTIVWLGVGAFRTWAFRRSVLDIPNHRSSHKRPTPRGGGLAIVLVTILGVVAFGNLFPRGLSRTALWAYVGSASLIAIVSWYDDLRSISAKVRFATHSLAALIAIVALGYWQTFPLLPGQEVSLSHFGAVITFMWIVGLTNAYNFMDGSDGIAGSQAVVAGLGWAYLGYLINAPEITVLSMLLAAASLGFLLHNWPPARIFMGDVGSAFLGYSFAVLPLLSPQAAGRLDGMGPMLGLLPVWPFVFDAAFTFLRRLLHGENVLAAHRSHLYQRLMIAGHSHRFVMLLYSALATVGAIAAIMWIRLPVAAYWGTAALLPLLATALHRFVVVQERRAEERRALETPDVVPMPLPKRRAA
jgi:UDP-N-acetylmuramyl pentapeptide phosphotransferase/UDP-N-acetylglucosamine-1-phosphate transferase